MASLTNQQIQNSYEGLLKTENNGALPNTETNITDGVGTQTGLYTENQYGIAGYKGVNAFPQWAIKNTNFDINNSPLGASGASQLSFTDANSFKTASIVQNRFGGITYFNSVDGQSHIFGGTNNNSPIRIDAYNSPNNSDNWYTGYNQSPDSLSFDTGTRDLTLGRTNTADLVVNIPGGGGGGGSQEVRSLSSVRPIGQAGFGLIETTYKMTHETTGYGTQNYQITSGTEFMVIPFTEVEGYTIDDIAFQVGTGVAGATTNIHLYKAVAKTVNLQGGGTQEVLDGTFVADLATNIDCSTSGMKFIGGIGQVLPSAADNLYFFLYRMDNATGVNMTAYSNSQVINPNNSVYLSGTITYRFVTWQSGGASSAPTDLDLQNMSASTGSGLIRTLYSTKA